MAAGGIHIDLVIEFWLPRAELLERSSGRLVHPASGRTYHAVFSPPKGPGKDDLTGEELVRRTDDEGAAAAKRLEVYDLHAPALANHYTGLAARGGPEAPRYVLLPADGPVTAVRERLIAAIDARWRIRSALQAAMRSRDTNTTIGRA
jgi:adenylate kinase